MKKNYQAPFFMMETLEESDVLTNSPSQILSDGEFENDEQWWNN